ncbi:MAG TPA: hypothetical protein PK020_11635 [Ilumatobacteraceae bacterium]|nr:hypothetical protein [Ilumatobacteraceae bacterium]
MSRPFQRWPMLAALCAVTVVSACNPTTYDSTAETTPPAAATTTTLPTGTAAQLLPLMLLEVQGLPQKVMNAKGDGNAATYIEQLWTAVEPEIEANRPELVPDFEFVVRRCRAAADRNRPADADRAFKNLTTLVQAYLG